MAWKTEWIKIQPQDSYEKVTQILREILLEDDSYERDKVIKGIADLCTWLEADPKAPVNGKFINAIESGAQIHTLRFGGYEEFGWPGIATLNDRFMFGFLGGFIFSGPVASTLEQS